MRPVLCVCAVAVATAGTATAQTIISQTRITQTSATTLTLTETPISASVVINGGPIVADEPLTTLDVFGVYWTVHVSGSINDSFNDEIAMTLTMQHVTNAGHNHDDLGTSYTTGYAINADAYENGTHTIAKDPVIREHPDRFVHYDRYFNESLTFSTVTDWLINDEIESWNYVLEARHVPSPGPVALAGAGLLVSIRRQRQRA